jgi:hypothetical protein
VRGRAIVQDVGGDLERRRRRAPGRRHRGAGHVDAVERGLGGDALLLTLEDEARLADGEFEGLGDLVLVNDSAHAQSDGVGALEFARLDAVLDRGKVALGGGE